YTVRVKGVEGEAGVISRHGSAWREAAVKVQELNSYGLPKVPAPVKLHRPTLREGTKAIIEKDHPKHPDGECVDPNNPTGPSIKQTDPWVYGHKKGHENWRLIKEAEAKGMTQADFAEWVNSNPQWFQIERFGDNANHGFELPKP